MHYAEFAEDEVRYNWGPCHSMRAADGRSSQSQQLLEAIRDYENNKWKVIGQKVGKPAKVRALYLNINRVSADYYSGM